MPLASLRPRDVARKLAMLSQCPTAPEGMTVGDLAAWYSDYLLVLEDGRLVARGEPHRRPRCPSWEAAQCKRRLH